MPNPPPRTPAESFATILQWLARAIADRGVGGRLAGPLIGLLLGRIREINQRFARLAARIASGGFVPRRTAPRRRPVALTPRRKNPLPQTFGWLLTLVPEAVGYRAQLEHLLRDPEMAALIAAAPAEMARTLRPLLWMLRLRPPPVLARSRQAAPSAPAPPVPLQAPPAPAPAPRPRLAHACGPPLPQPA